MAKICTSCGAAMEEEKRFCTNCGATLEEAAAPAPESPVLPVAAPKAPPPPPPPPRPEPTPQPVYQTPPPSPPTSSEPVPAKGSKYAPITTWGYIGIFLLLCIPLVGLVLMIVWACGKCKKIAKRNLARAMLILTVVGLVITLVIGIAGRALFKNVTDSIVPEAGFGLAQSENGGTSSDSDGGLGDLLSGLSGLGGEDISNSDIEELEALGSLLGGLGALTGEEGSGLDGLLDGAIDANKEAEAANDGWPKTLRKYPGGTATATASYRTEISNTSREEMMGWIEDLKKDGFAFQDFYAFGMSEEDMLSMDGWWAYDGKTYLSVSYYDGIVTVDHTKELPNLGSYFG